MEQWEYKIEEYRRQSDERRFVEWLNDKGTEGWLLVTTEHWGGIKCTCIFRRKIK